MASLLNLLLQIFPKHSAFACAIEQNVTINNSTDVDNDKNKDNGNNKDKDNDIDMETNIFTLISFLLFLYYE